MTLGELNIISGSFSDLPQDMTGKDFKIQILKTQNDDLQLELSDVVKSQLGNSEYKIGNGYVTSYDEIRAINTWADTYYKYKEFVDYYGTLGLATTDTKNDSIGLNISRYVMLDSEVSGVMGDTLELINQYETSETRVFNATIKASYYTVTENLGETSNGILSINGIKGTSTKSVIDFNKYSGFKLVNSTVLNINNVELSYFVFRHFCIFLNIYSKYISFITMKEKDKIFFIKRQLL